MFKVPTLFITLAIIILAQGGELGRLIPIKEPIGGLLIFMLGSLSLTVGLSRLVTFIKNDIKETSGQ